MRFLIVKCIVLDVLILILGLTALLPNLISLRLELLEHILQCLLLMGLFL